jgi:hypothetical protein
MFQVQLNLESVEFGSTSIHKALMKNGVKRQVGNFVDQHIRRGEALQICGKIQLVRKHLTDFNREEVFGSDGEVEENGDKLGGDRENAEVFLK